ncbi:MAG: hypothetical protein WBH85_07145 [Thermoanaerobaculia bacterium]
MQETFDLERSRLLLEFPDRQALDDYLGKSRKRGFMVRLVERLEEGLAVEVVLISGTTHLQFPTRVQQVFRSGEDRHGTRLEVLDWSQADALTPEAAAKDGGVESPSPTDEEAPEQAEGGETHGTSSFFEIQKLNPSQRILLASKANRQERQILLRETAPPVAMALLSNPRIEPKEVLQIAKSPQAASGVLQRIAQDRRFSGNYKIQLALVKNPKTPSPIATRMIELLHRNDLRDLAKSQSLRENIRKAVLRVYLRRSS